MYSGFINLINLQVCKIQNVEIFVSNVIGKRKVITRAWLALNGYKYGGLLLDFNL